MLDVLKRRPRFAPEPVGRPIALLQHTDRYGPVRVYCSERGTVSLSAWGDEIVVNGHTLTDRELRRGWYDPDERAGD